MGTLKTLFFSFFKDLQDYNFTKFKSDLNAGLVTGIVAIPLSLALAIATGVPPIWGLYTAVIAGSLGAIWGGSRFSVSGPAAAMVPILTGVITEYGLDALPFIGIIAGILLVIFGLLKFGSFIRYVPLSVTLGFTAGVAIVIFFGQLNSFLGITGLEKHEHFLDNVIATFTHLSRINWIVLLIGIVSLTLLILIPKLKYIGKIPASLYAVILGIIVVIIASPTLDIKTIENTYGQIPLGFPPLRNILDYNAKDFADFISKMLNLIIPALKVAFLISVESLLCAVVADKMTKTKHDSNRELVAQGIANIFSPIGTGIPATAVIARTGTSIKNGAQSRLAALIHAIVVLIFIVLIAPIGGKIPLAVLSSILFITAWKISEYQEIKLMIKKAPLPDLFVLFLTLFLTVFFDLVIAVGVGCMLSALIIFRKLSEVKIESHHDNAEELDEDMVDLLEQNHGITYLNVIGNLSMGAVDSLVSQCKLNASTHLVFIRLHDIQTIDLSGLDALDELIEHLHHDKKEVYLVSVKKPLMAALIKYGINVHVDGILHDNMDIIKRFNIQ